MSKKTQWMCDRCDKQTVHKNEYGRKVEMPSPIVYTLRIVESKENELFRTNTESTVLYAHLCEECRGVVVTKVEEIFKWVR